MHLNKVMIDLISEIRRRAPSEVKPAIKLANPDVLQEIFEVYKDSKDNILKALIRETFLEAGEPWISKAHRIDHPEEYEEEKEETVHYITKVYRGQRQLIEVENEEHTDLDFIKSPNLIYRGQKIAD